MPTAQPLRLLALALGAAALTACARGSENTPAPRGTSRTVNFVNAQGQPAGSATLTSTGDGVFISAQLRSLPEGTHGFHIHETGVCNAPSFESAGGHFNPTGQDHGFLDPDGDHAGDLPNITVRSDGTAAADVLAPDVTMGGGAANILDADGSALVVHAGVDDYRTDPSGNSGPRIACAVVR